MAPDAFEHAALPQQLAGPEGTYAEVRRLHERADLAGARFVEHAGILDAELGGRGSSSATKAVREATQRLATTLACVQLTCRSSSLGDVASAVWWVHQAGADFERCTARLGVAPDAAPGDHGSLVGIVLASARRAIAAVDAVVAALVAARGEAGAVAQVPLQGGLPVRR